MQVYCPRCAAAAPTGQRFCRSCGLKLDLIVDAMEGRQVKFDPESLKRDLLSFGESLRADYLNLKQTRHLKKEAKQNYHHEWIGNLAERGGQIGADIGMALGGAKSGAPTETRADRKLKQAIAKKLPATRKYSLQQGVLQMLSGAASAGAWYWILQTMGHAGFLASLEQIILNKSNAPLVGLAPILQMLWVFALIPVATGLGHLINGLFFAPQPEELRVDLFAPPQQSQVAPPPPAIMNPVSAVSSAVPTNELECDALAPASVVEDETRRFAAREIQPS